MDERTHDLHPAGEAGVGSGGASEAEAAADGHAAREAAERTRIQAVEAAQAHHVAMHTASETLGRVIGNAIEVSALLTWSPGRFAEMDRLVSTTVRNLGDFRAQLITATAAGVAAGTGQDTVQDPHDALPDLYVAALARMREVHRQMGALIALAEMDISNTPALIAMTRSIGEPQMLAGITNRGLSLVLDELGMVR